MLSAHPALQLPTLRPQLWLWAFQLLGSSEGHAQQWPKPKSACALSWRDLWVRSHQVAGLALCALPENHGYLRQLCFSGGCPTPTPPEPAYSGEMMEAVDWLGCAEWAVSPRPGVGPGEKGGWLAREVVFCGVNVSLASKLRRTPIPGCSGRRKGRSGQPSL